MSSSQDLVEAGAAATALARSESAERFSQTIQMVREAMLNPTVDADKARVMAELMTGLEDRANKSEFNRDLNAAIMDMPVITRAGIIVIPGKDGAPGRTQGRFARLEDIDRVVRPILRRNNLAIRFEVDESTKGVSVRPIISHANGYTERGGAMHLPLDTSGAKNNVQGGGSAVTYGKRYTMCAALNIITEGTDDDGSLGKFAIDMPHEREVLVLEQAEEAATNGEYMAWFSTQGVKDRGWLVSSGHHTRLGGTVALIGQGGSAPRDKGQGDKGNQKRTPEQMVEEYIAGVSAQGSMEELIAYQTLEARANWLDRVKVQRPDLHERVVAANTQRFEALSSKEN